jgi:hypothetical protein
MDLVGIKVNPLYDAVSHSKLSSFCNLMVPIGLPSLSMFQYVFFLMSFHCSIFNIRILEFSKFIGNSFAGP